MGSNEHLQDPELRNAFDIPAKCHWCGKDPPEFHWINFPNDTFSTGDGGTLYLCEDCVWSVCGGLLLDLVLDGRMTMDDLIQSLKDRLARVILLRNRRR